MKGRRPPKSRPATAILPCAAAQDRRPAASTVPTSATCRVWPIPPRSSRRWPRPCASTRRRALNLGKAANEYKVKTTDLSRYRIVAFATHGLLPGDLAWSHRARSCLHGPGGGRCGGRRAADDGGDPRAETRCGLGAAVGLQYVGRDLERSRRAVGTGARILLRWGALAAHHQLVGRFRFGASPRYGSVPAAGGRSIAGPRRGAAARNDGAG